MVTRSTGGSPTTSPAARLGLEERGGKLDTDRLAVRDGNVSTKGGWMAATTGLALGKGELDGEARGDETLLSLTLIVGLGVSTKVAVSVLLGDGDNEEDRVGLDDGMRLEREAVSVGLGASMIDMLAEGVALVDGRRLERDAVSVGLGASMIDMLDVLEAVRDLVGVSVTVGVAVTVLVEEGCGEAVGVDDGGGLADGDLECEGVLVGETVRELVMLADPVAVGVVLGLAPMESDGVGVPVFVEVLDEERDSELVGELLGVTVGDGD